MADHDPMLLERFNQMWKENDRIYHEVAWRSGLSDCAFWIMYGLMSAQAPMPQKDMSQAWQYSRQTVASALRQLERHGFIAVRLADGSRRDKVIELTEAGTAFVQRYVRPVAEAEREALERMGSGDADRLIGLMGRYTRLLDQTVHEHVAGPA